jgi:hypothetical protein
MKINKTITIMDDQSIFWKYELYVNIVNNM